MEFMDLNADIGEADHPEWAKAERAILNFISSANIACGGHAGNTETMHETVKGALAHGIIMGAHPAYPDRENFGRRSMILGKDIDTEVLRESLFTQITTLIKIANQEGTEIAYVKPHGALYNDAVHAKDTALLIADVITSIDPSLAFMGAPKSEMLKAAQDKNLSFIAEGFVDRRYTDSGHLQNRALKGAVIEDLDTRISQAKSLAIDGLVTTASGGSLRLKTRSLCVHGDSAGAVETARRTRIALEASGITIKSFVA